MAIDAPYPELKKTHTMAHKGRPWTDYKPPPAAPVWSVIEGLGSYYILLAAIELDVFDTLGSTGPVGVEVLSKKLEVSQPHLQSLLDSLVALGLLDQFVNIYELNDTAKRYLTSDGMIQMAKDALKRLLPGVWGVLSGAANVLTFITGLLVIMLYVVFLLIDYHKISARWRNYIPHGIRDDVSEFSSPSLVVAMAQ